MMQNNSGLERDRLPSLWGLPPVCAEGTDTVLQSTQLHQQLQTLGAPCWARTAMLGAMCLQDGASPGIRENTKCIHKKLLALSVFVNPLPLRLPCHLQPHMGV